MKITIKTAVELDFKTVWQGFNKKLLKKLSPPFPKVEIKSFSMDKGEKVEIILDIFIKRYLWVSVITESEALINEFYFIDEGIEIPLGMTYWRHKHRILKKSDSSFILDEVEFKTKYKLLEWLLYPLIFLQFLYRIPIYKSEFKKQQIIN